MSRSSAQQEDRLRARLDASKAGLEELRLLRQRQTEIVSAAKSMIESNRKKRHSVDPTLLEFVKNEYARAGITTLPEDEFGVETEPEPDVEPPPQELPSWALVGVKEANKLTRSASLGRGDLKNKIRPHVKPRNDNAENIPPKNLEEEISKVSGYNKNATKRRFSVDVAMLPSQQQRRFGKFGSPESGEDQRLSNTCKNMPNLKADLLPLRRNSLCLGSDLSKAYPSAYARSYSMMGSKTQFSYPSPLHAVFLHSGQELVPTTELPEDEFDPDSQVHEQLYDILSKSDIAVKKDTSSETGHSSDSTTISNNSRETLVMKPLTESNVDELRMSEDGSIDDSQSHCDSLLNSERDSVISGSSVSLLTTSSSYSSRSKKHSVASEDGYFSSQPSTPRSNKRFSLKSDFSFTSTGSSYFGEDEFSNDESDYSPPLVENLAIRRTSLTLPVKPATPIMDTIEEHGSIFEGRRRGGSLRGLQRNTCSDSESCRRRDNDKQTPRGRDVRSKRQSPPNEYRVGLLTPGGARQPVIGPPRGDIVTPRQEAKIETSPVSDEPHPVAPPRRKHRMRAEQLKQTLEPQDSTRKNVGISLGRAPKMTASRYKYKVDYADMSETAI